MVLDFHMEHDNTVGIITLGLQNNKIRKVYHPE